MTSKILVPVDFSDASKSALDHAVLYARALELDIELLHVAPDYFAPQHGLAGPNYVGVAELHAQLMDSALKNIAHMGSQLEKQSGIHVATHVSSGHAIEAIAAYAKESHAELIVAATHGRTGFDHFLMGSVCERILRVAPCPVLVARQPDGVSPKVRRVMVPVDCSGTSLRALERASTIANHFGAELEILHVWEQPYFIKGARPAPELVDRFRQDAHDKLEQFLAAADVPTHARQAPTMLVGAPAVTILGRVSEQPPDLIVMGTHGRSGLKHLVLGSVAETVTRYAPCSVLVVR